MIDRRSGLGALLFALSAQGHHSDAGVDMDALVELEGTVTEYNWRNPHVYFKVATAGSSGESIEWLLQMPSTMTMARMGWGRESLAAGERVRVWTHPSEDGRHYGILEYAQKADGTRLPTSFEHGDRTADPLFDIGENPRAESIEGTWIADRSKLTLYPGGFDGFFREQLVLTEAARAAQASYDELSSENPESTCVGRPTPAMLVSTTIFPIQIDIAEDRQTVVIRSELYDEERTVYMDGRTHPDGEQRFETGYSVGNWEDDVLVVDTSNFTDHRSPYQ
ncbi:MAG TPA: DUF6152 family protein, partial [Gammaproteobacteria bacterium]|nr:DUF6152 family protein [Gammaproteobacteria bacterium]